MRSTLVWFRNDLRIDDHPALHEASTQGNVFAVYCIDPRHTRTTPLGFAKMSPRRVRFLHETLHDLRTSLRARGGDLIIRHGTPHTTLPTLAKELGATHLFSSVEVTDEETRVTRAVDVACDRHEITHRTFRNATLLHPDDLPFDLCDLPEVFTQFRKRVEHPALRVRSPLPAPTAMTPLPEEVDPGEIPTSPTCRDDPRAALEIRGGESVAKRRVTQWFWERDRLRRYKETRNGLLGADYSSKLSPWLALGAISPRRVYEQVRAYEAERIENKSTYWLVFELLWRDYFHFLAEKHGNSLFHLTGIKKRDLRWERDIDTFTRWCDGETGVPFIDANMRELRETGFMSNRGRQNVGSFLTRTLHIDWRWGAHWFEHQLLDYDPCSNWGNWQYISGVGNDPRDRTFNVLLQARRYDPKANYVKHWIPALDPLPTSLAHEPWGAPRKELMERFNIRIPQDYPSPLINMDRVYR